MLSSICSAASGADDPLSTALQMVRIHLRGQEAKNDLKRPFNANAPAGFMGGGGPATDKASIEAAEKANLLHRKEEF